MAAPVCTSVPVSTVYQTATITSRVPAVTGTRLVREVTAVVSTTLYTGVVRGQTITRALEATELVTVTSAVPITGLSDSLVVVSTPVSVIYSTSCLTSSRTTTSAPTSSSTTTTTTSTTTTPPTSSSTSTTPPPVSSTRISTVIVPPSSASSSSARTSATALSGSSGSHSGSPSNLGAIIGGAVGGAAGLAALVALLWLCNKKSRDRKNQRDFDPFTSTSDPWDPSPGSASGAVAGGAAGAGLGAAAGARHSRRLTRGHSKYAEANEKDAAAVFPAYAAVATEGSPGRSRKLGPSAEQDAYYAHVPYAQGAPQDDGESAYAHTDATGLDHNASMYDHSGAASAAPHQPASHPAYDAAPYAAVGGAAAGYAAAHHHQQPERSASLPPGAGEHARNPSAGAYGAGTGMYGAASSYDQHGRDGGYAAAAHAPAQQQPQAPAPYGQPGGYMHYPSQSTGNAPQPGYPPYSAAQPSYPPQAAAAGGIPFHAHSPSSGGSAPNAAEALPLPGQHYQLSDRPSPPAALTPGAPGGAPLRVVNESREDNDDDERARFGGRAAEMDAYGGLEDGLPYRL